MTESCDRPTRSKRDLGHVSYVDVLDSAGIREHYASDPNVIVDLVPEIDYPPGRAEPRPYTPVFPYMP